MLRPETVDGDSSPGKVPPLPAIPLCPSHWCNNFSAALEVGESGLTSGGWGRPEPSRYRIPFTGRRGVLPGLWGSR